MQLIYSIFFRAFICTDSRLAFYSALGRSMLLPVYKVDFDDCRREKFAFSLVEILLSVFLRKSRLYF